MFSSLPFLLLKTCRPTSQLSHSRSSTQFNNSYFGFCYLHHLSHHPSLSEYYYSTTPNDLREMIVTPDELRQAWGSANGVREAIRNGRKLTGTSQGTAAHRGKLYERQEKIHAARMSTLRQNQEPRNLHSLQMIKA